MGILVGLFAFIGGINLLADPGSIDTGLTAVFLAPFFAIHGFLTGLATLLFILTHQSPGA